jgi:hypothetical protein
LTTKILALVDALGNLVDFRLMPGQRGETTGVAALIEGINFSAFLETGLTTPIGFAATCDSMASKP